MLHFNFTKKRAAFCPSNNTRTHFIYNLSQIKKNNNNNNYNNCASNRGLRESLHPYYVVNMRVTYTQELCLQRPRPEHISGQPSPMYRLSRAHVCCLSNGAAWNQRKRVAVDLSVWHKRQQNTFQFLEIILYYRLDSDWLMDMLMRAVIFHETRSYEVVPGLLHFQITSSYNFSYFKDPYSLAKQPKKNQRHCTKQQIWQKI